MELLNNEAEVRSGLTSDFKPMTQTTYNFSSLPSRHAKLFQLASRRSRVFRQRVPLWRDSPGCASQGGASELKSYFVCQTKKGYLYWPDPDRNMEGKSWPTFYLL